MTSPIIPTKPDDNGGGDDPNVDPSEQKLSSGAIFGIIAGSLFVVGILGFMVYKFALPSKSTATRNGS